MGKNRKKKAMRKNGQRVYNINKPIKSDYEKYGYYDGLSWEQAVQMDIEEYNNLERKTKGKDIGMDMNELNTLIDSIYCDLKRLNLNKNRLRDVIEAYSPKGADESFKDFVYDCLMERYENEKNWANREVSEIIPFIEDETDEDNKEQ